MNLSFVIVMTPNRSFCHSLKKEKCVFRSHIIDEKTALPRCVKSVSKNGPKPSLKV